MGILSKRKGRAHEQAIATKLRAALPQAIVRRSDQGHGAHEPDVVVEGDAPEEVRRLWIECQHARRPNPLKKLDQARHDSTGKTWVRIPVAVVRKHGSTDDTVTMGWDDFIWLMTGRVPNTSPNAISSIEAGDDQDDVPDDDEPL